MYKPIYDYVFSAIPAEKRLMMMLQKKLKSLDANTTSNQKQSEAVLSVDDFLNKYGDRVVTSYLKDNPEINDLLDDPLKLKDSSADSGNAVVMEDAAHRVSGRVAVLPTAMQEKFYTTVLKLYKEEIEYLKQIDEYDLEVDVLDLKATSIDKSIKIVGKGGQSAFGDNTYIEKCEVNILKKPYSVTELENLYVQALEGKDPRELRDILVNRYEFSTTETLKRIGREIEEDYALKIKNLDKEKAIVTLKTEAERNQFKSEREQLLLQAKAEKKAKEIEKQNNRQQAMTDIINFFTVGRKVFYLLDMENASSAKSIAVCLGVKVDLNNDKPFLPSNMKLQVAIASGKKRIDINLSKVKDINAIMGVSSNLSQPTFDQLKNEWQAAIKSTTKDRGTAYIVSGNLLQSYGNDDFNKGRLISYTTSDGKTLKGRLMPDGWEPPEVSSENMIKVPISKAVKVIASLANGKSISTDGGAIIAKTNDNFKLMDDGRFDKTSNYMVAAFMAGKLKKVVEILQRNHNASVELQAYQLDMIIDEVGTDKGTEQVSDNVIKAVAKEIEERLTESKLINDRVLIVKPNLAPSPGEVNKANVLRLRLALKARAVKVKLKLAA
ncbi:MAG: hypothetical protein AAB638_00660 [Patescibacteria group bacterium]